jgi:hypothetical protein
MLQNLGAHHGMDLHFFKFVGRQLAGFGNNGFRNRQLSDVVEQRRRPQCVQLRFGKAQVLSDFERVELNALQVIVRGVILGVDGERQRLDSSEVQRIHFHDVFVFLLNPDGMRAIGSVNQVDQRQTDDGDFPLNGVRNGSDQPSHGSAHRVVGQHPAIFAPDSQDWLAFGKADNASDWKCVRAEIIDGQQRQAQRCRHVAVSIDQQDMRDVDGGRQAAHVEQNLHGARPRGHLPGTLDQHRRDSNHHGLKQTQVHHSHQDEQ